MSGFNNILTSVVEEIYILHEKEDWVLDMSDVYGSITNLPKLFEELSLDKAINMYSVLDQKLFDAYSKLKVELIIAIIQPNIYSGKFDWAKEILHNAVCVFAEVARIGQEFVLWSGSLRPCARRSTGSTAAYSG